MEQNSEYAYMLICGHFASTSLVAEIDDKIAGFVAAYRPPSEPQSLFVWQIGVRKAARGYGVGLSLLRGLVERCPDVDYLTATVSPENQASARLFEAFAQMEAGSRLKIEDGFTSSLFAGSDHPDEPLYRIGPLNR